MYVRFPKKEVNGRESIFVLASVCIVSGSKEV